MIALAIDGTLLADGAEITPVTTQAVAAVRAAGHHVVLATRRSLAGALPVAAQFGLGSGRIIIASNGAVIARLDRTAPAGYVVEAEHTFDVEPVVQLAHTRMPDVRIGVERVGRGYDVTHRFDAAEIDRAQQRIVERPDELWTTPVTRMALSGPGVTSLLEPLRRLGVTATPAGDDHVDVTARGLSKATALDVVRQALGVDVAHTVAIGDSWDDREMIARAEVGIAMGNAPEAIKALANHTTRTVHENGAAAALQQLLTPGSALWLAPAIGRRNSSLQSRGHQPAPKPLAAIPLSRALDERDTRALTSSRPQGAL